MNNSIHTISHYTWLNKVTIDELVKRAASRVKPAFFERFCKIINDKKSGFSYNMITKILKLNDLIPEAVSELTDGRLPLRL